MSAREQRTIAKTAVECISKIVRASAPQGDVSGMANIIAERPEFKSLFAHSVELHRGRLEALEQLERNIAIAYVIHHQQKNAEVCRQLLSLFTIQHY